MKTLLYSITFLCCLPIPALAQDLESDLLEAKTGSLGKNLGAEVINIIEENKTTTVEVKIPVDDLENYQVIVVIEDPASP